MKLKQFEGDVNLIDNTGSLLPNVRTYYPAPLHRLEKPPEQMYETAFRQQHL